MQSVNLSGSLFQSSIGRKLLVALSALGLVIFLVIHLSGNLLIFAGQDAFNTYSHTLKSLPLMLWSVRLGLLLVFLLHLGLSIQLIIENRRARPSNYRRKNTVQASLASRSMGITGTVMLSYIVYHLLHFTFGLILPENHDLTDVQKRHDVYRMVVLGFQNPVIVISYLVAIFATMIHLSHGIPSLFQSVGWRSPRASTLIRRIGKSIAMILFLGYSSIPLAIYIELIKLP